MNRLFSLLLFTGLLLGYFTLLSARQPYHATVTVGPFSKTVSAPNLVDLRRELQTNHLQNGIPFYTAATPASINFNIRGITALGTFPANSPTLIVSMPQLGTTDTFTGATREDSITLFKDFLRDGGHNHRIFKTYAKFSPIDPIAGNPNSLQAQMAQADYLIGHLSPFSGCDSCWSAQPIVHQYQAGLSACRGFSKGFDTTSISLPLRYSFSPDLNWAFILDAPLTYIRNGGASSLFGSLGLGVRVPIIHNWSLTPVVRFGFGGTLDLCTAGCFATAGLTSVYNYKISDYVVSMTNYAGYFTTTNFWLTGVNFTYHLHNYIFKNGLSITSCKGFTFCNRPINFSLSFEDSYFARDRLFMRHFDEVGISMITTYLIPYFNYDCLSIGFAYQFGEKNYRGYVGNFTYQF
jgi:hypothetical protein